MKRLFTNLMLGLVLGLAAASSWSQALTNTAENKIIDALMRAQSLGAPATLYWRLNTTSCSDSASGTEVTGGSYARVAVTASLANWAGTQSAGSTSASSGTGGTTSNNAAITFPTPSAGWGTVTSVEGMDASSGGNSWLCIALTSSQTINTGNTVSFPIGTLTLAVD